MTPDEAADDAARDAVALLTAYLDNDIAGAEAITGAYRGRDGRPLVVAALALLLAVLDEHGEDPRAWCARVLTRFQAAY